MNNIIKGNCEATSELKKLVEMVSISNSTVLLREKLGVEKMLLHEQFIKLQKEKETWLM